jgi:hypothetical protein
MTNDGRMEALLGIAVLAAVFAGTGGYGSARQFLAGFTPAIFVCAAVALAGALVSLAVPGRRTTPIAIADQPMPEARNTRRT